MWIFWGLLIVLTAGFAKLSVIILNRMLALPQPKAVMASIELIQLLLMPVYIGLVFRELGGHRIEEQLAGSSWDSVTPLEIVVVTIGMIGFGLLVRSSLAYLRYRPPACQISCETTVIDFRQMNGGQPWHETLVGPRPMRRIALLPGNEQFSLEVSTQTYVLPRLPKEWDGLSIVHLTDTHFCGAVTRQYFEAVCERAAALKPDLFIFTGDLLDDQLLLEWLPETLGRLKAPLGQYFILGNHDWYLDSEAIRREFERLGWTDMSSRSQAVTSTKASSPIILAGDETPWMGTHPILPSEPNSAFRILLSHTPDNIEWARRQRIDLVLAGHTHGGQIRLPIIGPVYAPSRHGCRFASGVFWLNPTLLCVSRGISGREPIRYQCRPELTKLILKSATD